jgi:cohesin loading factor subunit SCC2
VRYMAENVSAFDYKTQEETLTVIRHLTSVLSVVGMALVETISPTTLREQVREVPDATANEVTTAPLLS